MKSETRRYDIENSIAFITFDRPEGANGGLNLLMGKELVHAAVLCDEDRVTVYSYSQLEGRIQRPGSARTAGCGRASFARDDNKTYDGIADDLVLVQSGP